MAALVFALLGGVVGGALLSDFGGAVLGAAVGALVGWVSELAGRVRQLERRLDARAAAAAAAPAAAQGGDRFINPSPDITSERAADGLRNQSPPSPDSASERAAGGSKNQSPPEPAVPRPRAQPATSARANRVAARAAQGPSAVEALLKKAGRWFTTGNVPVKVGVVLSLFGVGFLVKEGIDREWLVLPDEMRLMLVALFGIGLLVLGWRLRTQKRAYALPVQGGGIGVLYLTIYASFGFYDLLPAAPTFALLVAVTAAAGVLAVLQDARSLAVLGIFGGFMAPVLASTDSGNHVALFSYYALLDVAIVAIAWFKAWRVLNVLGFVFTFGIATLWGADAYRPELFATTEPFLVLFTLMFLVIPVLFALRTAPSLRGFVDGTLMFGTPIVAFALQSRLVGDTEYGLAISAVVLALVYVGMATFLYRTRRDSLRVLVEAQLALGIAFVTVAVPLALDARWTSAAWALQGAALVWLAFRQQRKLALLAGLALQALSGIAYANQPFLAAEQPFFAPDWPIVNGFCLGALLLALTGLFSARLFDPEREPRELHPALPDWLAKLTSIALLAWGGGWWLFAGFTEVVRNVASDAQFASLLGFASATALLAMLAAERVAWPRLNWLSLTLWPLAAFFASVALLAFAHPARELGWVAWPIVAGAMLWFLRAREQRFPRLAGALHVTAYWLFAGLVAWETAWLVDQAADGVWPAAAVLALAAALALATLRATRGGTWPFAAHARSYAQVGCGAVLATAAAATVALNVSSAGVAEPLPYVPLANPLELASALVVLALLRWIAVVDEQNPALGVRRARPAVAAAAGWFLVTMAVARTVHHWAGVPYDLDSLAESTTFQSALSIVWGLGGLAAMVVGARGSRRAVWIVGAALMVVVVAKLFLVDLGNTGTWARVVSFLGVGLLLLVVGYFAPVPPRAAAEARAA